ncbi:MAG: UMP kinase, partial [Alistipes sp.]|nr:UMP kinase [Alistipes sp.]
VKFDEISIEEVVEKKLGVIDMAASVLCMENKIPLLVFALQEKNSIVNALTGNFSGTKVTV